MAVELISLGIPDISIEINEITYFIPWLNVISFALDILELAGVIPDPISLLLNLFAGRPKEEATVQQAQRLLTAQNPAARLFGISLERMVKEFDIVTSTGGSGRAILDLFTAQFTANLEAQGISQSRAFQILENALSEAAQSGLELEPELTQQLDPTLNFNGDPHTQQSILTEYNKAIANGQNCKDALKAAETWVWKNEPLAYVAKMRIGPYLTQTPPLATLVPGPDCKCPAGYTIDPATELCVLNTTPQQCPEGEHWDPTTGTCVPDTQPQQCPPGFHWDPNSEQCVPDPLNIPILPWPQPDPNGDTISYELCFQLGGYFSNLIEAIFQAANPQGGTGTGTDSECCTEILASMTNVITVLGTIAANISSAGAPLDLSPIVNALGSLTTAVSALPTAPAVDLGPVTSALEDIKTAIASAAPADVSGIVDQLKQANTINDVSDTLIAALKAQGFIGAATQGFYQGMHPADAAFADRHTWWHDTLRGFIIGATGVDIDTGSDLNPTVGAAAEWIASAIKHGLNASDSVILPVIKPFIDLVKSQIAPATTPGVGGAGVDLDTPVASALSVTASAAIMGYVLSFTGIDAGEPLAHIAEIIAGAIGWEQLRDVQIGPLVREGLEQIAVQQARKLFQQNLPGAGQAANWLGRGIIDAATADNLEALNGLHTSLRAAANAGATGGWSPRQLIRAIESGYFTDSDIADELTFAGMRTVSQHRFLLASAWIATNPQRNKLIAAIEAAYRAGMMADADFTSNIDSANHNVDADNLLLTAMHWDLLVTETKMLEKEYVDMYIGGVHDDATLRTDLATIGLQPGYIDIVAGAAEARANITLQKSNLRQAAAQAKAENLAARKAAVEAYKIGTGNAATLSAALLLTGLSAAQVASQVSLVTGQQQGSLRWKYGLLKTPTEATLLAERVGALTDQRKRLQIDETTYLQALQALGLPARVINALNAGANSMITPKTSAVVIPVQTS